MATSDPSKYRQQFEDELRRLDDLEYEADARAIRTWANRLTVAYSTRATRVVHARKLSARAAAGGLPPLVEMASADDFYELHDTLRDGTNPDVKDDGLAESTLRTIRQSARSFFRDGIGVDWAEEIRVGGPQQTKVTEDDIYVAEEVEALFEGARNARDKAIMAVLLVTGLRLTALLSLDYGDVEFGEGTGFINVSDDAIGLKGFAGKRPLLWATEYVKNWRDIHPTKEPGDALFCPIKDQSHPDRASPGESLSPWGIQQQLRRVKRRAVRDNGFPEEKAVNPHNFRHSAVTRMVREGLSDQRIKWLVGWTEDSGQLARYTHLKDDEMLAGVLEHYDVEMADPQIGQPTLENCPACGALLSEWVNPVACPGCGASFSFDSADVSEVADEIKDDVTETALSEDLTDEQRAGLRVILELVDDPVELATRLAEVDVPE